MKIRIRISYELIVLLLFWLFATIINFNKAYHIDDTVHLETAQWIIKNPLNPMSGMINWDQNEAPIHNLNQPHLYFYILAIWGIFFGFSEASTHILQSFFTLICIVLVYLITKIIIPNHRILITGLLTLSPAFIVGQNLMVDIPLLSFFLGFYYCLINPQIESEKKRLILAGVIAGFACLIKYSALPLLLVMLLYIILKRRFELIWTFFIPIIILLLWSGFNYFDYGAIHILDRPRRELTISIIFDMSRSWLICLGSIIPYSMVWLINIKKDSKNVNLVFKIFVTLSLIVLVILISGLYFNVINEKIVEKYLKLLFFSNGITISIILLTHFVFESIKILVMKELNHSIILLYLWLISSAAFIIIFSPFLATRHILLVIVPITLILVNCSGINSSLLWKITAISVTTFLALALGISDRIWANYYRENAVLIREQLPKKSTIYFTGHWGWQWYAKKNGMQQLESLNPQIKPGDYLVYPQGIHQQRLDKIPSQYKLKFVREYKNEPSRFTFFKTDTGRFYASSFNKLPWLVNRRSFDSIIVYKVVWQDVQK
ncbi:MAG: glycosyltransferase family 39 protein [Sphaerospermopsis sp. SIO1G1]|nr:glycosyltransferase family 39 protein [Sphaerospermopsis sp. SIO1G1]